MPTLPNCRFQHAALVGKYHARGIRPVLEDVAHLLARSGLDVSLESETALATGMSDYPALSLADIGRQCDVAVVVGGDGTMLAIARELARYDVPLIGVNQGRLGFITDIQLKDVPSALPQILSGRYEREERAMLEGAGVATVPGTDFDEVDGDRFIRMCFAGTPEDMAEAARRLKEWLRPFHGVATEYLDHYLGWRRKVEVLGTGGGGQDWLRAALGIRVPITNAN